MQLLLEDFSVFRHISLYFRNTSSQVQISSSLHDYSQESLHGLYRNQINYYGFDGMRSIYILHGGKSCWSSLYPKCKFMPFPSAQTYLGLDCMLLGVQAGYGWAGWDQFFCVQVIWLIVKTETPYFNSPNLLRTFLVRISVLEKLVRPQPRHKISRDLYQYVDRLCVLITLHLDRSNPLNISVRIR